MSAARAAMAGMLFPSSSDNQVDQRKGDGNTDSADTRKNSSWFLRCNYLRARNRVSTSNNALYEMCNTRGLEAVGSGGGDGGLARPGATFLVVA